MFLGQPKEKLGVEISATHLRLALFSQKEGKPYCIDQHEVSLPENLIKPGFNRINILDSDRLQTVLRDGKKKMDIRGCKVGVAIPPESTKYIVKSFPTLPEGDLEIAEMIRWSLGRSLKFDPASLEIRWAVFPKHEGGSTVLLIGLMSKSVVEEYRGLFERVGWVSDPLISSDIAFFNFYSHAISDDGVIAWLGIFQDTLSLLVLSRGVPQFYKNLKKRLISKSDLDNIDMLLQYYMEEHPDLTIDRYYLSAASPSDLENTFSWTLFNAEEYELLTPQEHIVHRDMESLSRWPFAPAVGAAWGRDQ